MIGVNSLKSLIVGSNKGNIVGKGKDEEVRVGVCYLEQDPLEGGGKQNGTQRVSLLGASYTGD